jgi:putative ABC transport system ATP-binding protein
MLEHMPSAPVDALLTASDLRKTYPDPGGEVTALQGFSYAFPAGQITAIMGPSGSGKTTLLNLLAGLDTPTSGTVKLDGKVISARPENARAEVRLRRFGFVFQSYNLVAVLNAWQNVAFPMGLANVGPAERKARALELLRRFGLERRAHHLPHKLSGGERQRVSVARALANDPSVIFADEPTGNLDSKSGRVVIAALREAAQEGRTVILVTHDLRLIDEVDGVLELADGVLERVRPTRRSAQPVGAP